MVYFPVAPFRALVTRGRPVLDYREGHQNWTAEQAAAAKREVAAARRLLTEQGSTCITVRQLSIYWSAGVAEICL